VGAHRLTWLDVFTDTPLAGNGLAVVHDADGLDDATMQAFARETRLSETTFVQAPQADGADYRNRIFTLAGELPFAGHPSLGTAVAVAAARGEDETRYVQQTTAGCQPVEVRRTGERAFAASMLQEPATAGPPLDPAPLLGAAGLTGDAAHRELPWAVVSTGTPHVIAPLPDAAALASLAPDAARLGENLGEAVTLYLCAVDPAGATAHARALLLDHTGAVLEDPATGSAAGPLLAHLHAHTGARELTVTQGVEMGRPSRLRCTLEGGRVRVGGDVVIVAEGTVWL